MPCQGIAPCPTTTMKKKYQPTQKQIEYKEWLSGPKWKRIRRAAIKRYGNACEMCGRSHRRIQLHHMFYAKNWDDTKIEHLIPLCNLHHKTLWRFPHKGLVTDEVDLIWFRQKLIDDLIGYHRSIRRKSFPYPEVHMDGDANWTIRPTFAWACWIPKAPEGHIEWKREVFGFEGPPETWIRQMHRTSTLRNDVDVLDRRRREEWAARGKQWL